MIQIKRLVTELVRLGLMMVVFEFAFPFGGRSGVRSRLPSSTSESVPAAENTSADNVTVPVSEPVSPPVAPVPVEKTVAPTEFMIFMGDFIYADVPVYYGDDKEAYRRFYRRNYNSPSFRRVYERLRKRLLWLATQPWIDPSFDSNLPYL